MIAKSARAFSVGVTSRAFSPKARRIHHKVRLLIFSAGGASRNERSFRGNYRRVCFTRHVYNGLYCVVFVVDFVISIDGINRTIGVRNVFRYFILSFYHSVVRIVKEFYGSGQCCLQRIQFGYTRIENTRCDAGSATRPDPDSIEHLSFLMFRRVQLVRNGFGYLVKGICAIPQDIFVYFWPRRRLC
ncbi:hypothetical protein [Mycobacterium aquaticum]|uniref:hypothetical protein n=1 Tax=Mycobacterium aquaticum TaxID=1927124 RepID=UPI00114FE262|nr:hypothetical protein [Mycobacterium aquaticum]